MKRGIIVIPALLVGVGAAGLTISQAFAQSTTNTPGPAIAASAVGTTAPSGNGGNDGSQNSWLNYMGTMMGGFFGTGAAQNGNGANKTAWFNEMGSVMGRHFGAGVAQNGKNADNNAWVNGSMMGGY